MAMSWLRVGSKRRWLKAPLIWKLFGVLMLRFTVTALDGATSAADRDCPLKSVRDSSASMNIRKPPTKGWPDNRAGELDHKERIDRGGRPCKQKSMFFGLCSRRRPRSGHDRLNIARPVVLFIVDE